MSAGAAHPDREGLVCRQEAEEHDRAMNALEAALDDARSHERSREQKLLVATKELKASNKLEAYNNLLQAPLSKPDPSLLRA